MKRFCATALLLTTLPLFSASFQWDNPAGGSLDWATNTNWSPNTGFPNAMDDQATFGTPPSGALAATVLVTSGANKTVGQLLFGTNATAFTYQLQSGYNVLMSATGNPLIQVQSGANPITIVSGIGLSTGATLDVNVASGESLTTSGVISNGTGLPVAAFINCIGQGTWTISGGSQNLFGGLNVSGGGTVLLQKSINTNAFGGNLNITNGSTVKLMTAHQMPTTILTINSGGIFDLNNLLELPVNLNFYNGSVLNATAFANQLRLNQIVLRNVTLNANLSSVSANSGVTTFDTTNGGTAVMQGLYNLLGSVSFNIPHGDAAVDLRVESVLLNGSITKTGNGTMMLAGANTYTGTTTVSAGTLLVGDGTSGSLANTAVTVNAGGTLGGRGTIGTGTASVANSGTVAPGVSPGTLTINGSYTQTALGTLDIELLSPTSFDQLIVAPGSVSLNGTLNLDLVSGYSFSGNNTLTLIDNTGGSGVSGTFSAVTDNFPSGSTFNVIYNANSVQLDFTLAPPTPPTPPPVPPPPNPSPNQTTTLNYLNSLTTIPGILAQLSVLTPDELGNALNAIAPTRNAIGSVMSVNTLFTMNNNITSRLAVKRFASRFGNRRTALTAANDEPGDPHLIALSICGPKNDPSDLLELQVPTPPPKLKKDLWVQGFENWTDVGGTEINTGFNASAGGPVIGFDWSRENWIAGAAAGYASTRVDEKHDAGQITTNSYFLNLYGTISKRWVYLETELLAAYNTFQEIRNIDYPGFAARARSNHHGYQLVPHGGIGLLYDTRWGMVQWYANIDWAFVFEERFKEHGAAPLDMAQAENRSSMLRTEAGVNVYHSIDTSAGIIFIKETAAYVYRQPFQLGIIQAQIVGASGFFIVESFNDIQNLGLARLELYYRSKSSDSYFGLGYQGEFGSKYSLNAGQLTVGKYF